MTDRKNNVSEELMRRIWRREYGMEFDRDQYEKQRAYNKFKADHWRRMAERDEAERKAQQVQQGQPRVNPSDKS